MESAAETGSGLLSEIEVLQAIYADSVLVLPADSSNLGTIIWHPSSGGDDVEFEFRLPSKKSCRLRLKDEAGFKGFAVWNSVS